MVVSRWLVIPTAAMSVAERLASASADEITSRVLFQISVASCSTQPLWGKYCVVSFWAMPQRFPKRSKMMARVLVVPLSMARTNCDMSLLASRADAPDAPMCALG
jgi:hypothetical protein